MPLAEQFKIGAVADQFDAHGQIGIARFRALIEHGLKAAGATQTVLADPARELLFRASRGVPRVASHLLRRALHEAHTRNQTFIDDHTMEAAIDAAPAVQAVAG